MLSERDYVTLKNGPPDSPDGEKRLGLKAARSALFLPTADRPQ